MTWLIVVQTPGLDVVLGQLGVGEQQHGGGHQLHIVLIKLLQLQLHSAHLGITSHLYIPYLNLYEVGLVFGVKFYLRTSPDCCQAIN